MNWQDIKVSADNTHFLFDNKPIFGKRFLEVLKFHSPGLAPVKDKSGAYHIDTSGNQLYTERFSRTFGFYCHRASVVQDGNCFHITEKGERAYANSFSWVGNFQENLCTVRDKNNKYFHINKNGNRIYKDDFIYSGDYKDGVACVKMADNLFMHIDLKGNFIHSKSFFDLGVYHKGFASARDNIGWHHINREGNEIYSRRFLNIEPFYNGFALATNFDRSKIIIDEKGQTVITV